MNLKTLAQTLGISETTVSRALNGYPEVSERTRERVLAAAKAVGYRPNPLARSLAVGRTNVLAIVYPTLAVDFADPAFLHSLSGMSDAAASKTMDLIIAPVPAANEMCAYEMVARERRVDGLIVSRTRVHDERIRFLAERNVPFVAYGRTELDKPYAWFDYDHAAGMALAIRELHGHGHRRIGFIGGAPDTSAAQQRRTAFAAVAQSCGLATNPQLMIDGADDRNGGYDAMRRLLGLPERPSGVVIANGPAAAGALRALREAGLVAGRDISVVAWNSREPALAEDGVTMIDEPNPHAAGEKMVEMLIALLDGTSPTDLQVTWAPALIPGVTVATPR
ncbi:LacI family transcriptional regulator [Oxalobacteraceae bacterium OM1]|nr:LacI family transcriptional regulator [Oxalobacteraceae bacterium OM1]